MTERSRLTRSSRPALAVLLHGALAGHVYQSANRKLVFQYADEWRAQPGAFPLSLSMPLTRAEHGHGATSAFLWGLLPDDPTIIQSWARQYGISGTDVVQILAHKGEDCPGAIQIIPSAQLETLLGQPTETEQLSSIEWLSKRDIEKLLTGLRLNPAASRTNDTQGQFSLAGAQPKTTLFYADGKWGIPKGRVPSTHILKPPVLDLADLADNEHGCLQLARELGLTAAQSTVHKFGKETAIVVERYDRQRLNGIVMRVHQEDTCQALAVKPEKKYETDGGPTVVDIAKVLSRYSSEPQLDVARFIEANVFNWFIAATDAHAKNYSILHAFGPQHRLAPLYDLISALPYPSLSSNGIKLAMSVSGEQNVAAITGKHWQDVARAVDLPARALLDRIVELGERVPDAIDRVIEHASNRDARTIVTRLMTPIGTHVTACLKRL